MTREEKIQAIYEKIANKELTFWCRVNTEYWRIVSIVEETADERWYIVVSEESLYNDEDIGAYYCWLRVRWLETMEQIDIAEIIWHPVMIWDVLRYCSSYISDWDDSVDSQIDLLSYWGDYRLPIEDQPEECIDFVHSQTLKS